MVSYNKVQLTLAKYTANAGTNVNIFCVWVSNPEHMMALQPIKAPQLNVRPRNPCGQLVNRLAAGYIATGNKQHAPNTCKNNRTK